MSAVCSIFGPMQILPPAHSIYFDISYILFKACSMSGLNLHVL